MSRDLDQLALELNSGAIHLLRRMRTIDDASGVARARLSALSVLVFGGSLTLGELARAEGVTSATIHHIVQALVSDRLAQSKSDPGDRRKVTISATRKGRSLMLRAREARLHYLREKMAGLSDADRSAMERTVKILRSWEAAPEAP